MLLYQAICVKCGKEYKEAIASSNWLSLSTPEETVKDSDTTERYYVIIIICNKLKHNIQNKTHVKRHCLTRLTVLVFSLAPASYCLLRYCVTRVKKV